MVAKKRKETQEREKIPSAFPDQWSALRPNEARKKTFEECNGGLNFPQMSPSLAVNFFPVLPLRKICGSYSEERKSALGAGQNIYANVREKAKEASCVPHQQQNSPKLKLTKIDFFVITLIVTDGRHPAVSPNTNMQLGSGHYKLKQAYPTP